MKFILINLQESWGEREIILNLEDIKNIIYDYSQQCIEIHFGKKYHINGLMSASDFESMKEFISDQEYADGGSCFHRSVFKITIDTAHNQEDETED